MGMGLEKEDPIVSIYKIKDTLWYLKKGSCKSNFLFL
jgi:hypothetical protein